MLPGVGVGGVLSLTVMVCVQSAVLPQASVARYVRVMFREQPDGATSTMRTSDESPTNVTVAGPQLSDAVTEPGSGGGTSERQSTVTGDGHVIVGGVES